MPEEFEPKIVAFFCNWCTYLAADLAGTSRIKYVPNAEVVDRLRRAGLLAVAAGENVVRLLPPLIIEESHVAEAAGIIDRVARQWAA